MAAPLRRECERADLFQILTAVRKPQLSLDISFQAPPPSPRRWERENGIPNVVGILDTSSHLDARTTKMVEWKEITSL